MIFENPTLGGEFTKSNLKTRLYDSFLIAIINIKIKFNSCYQYRRKIP